MRQRPSHMGFYRVLTGLQYGFNVVFNKVSIGFGPVFISFEKGFNRVFKCSAGLGGLVAATAVI